MKRNNCVNTVRRHLRHLPWKIRYLDRKYVGRFQLGKWLFFEVLRIRLGGVPRRYYTMDQYREHCKRNPSHRNKQRHSVS